MKRYKFLKDFLSHVKGDVIEMSEADAAPLIEGGWAEETAAEPASGLGDLAGEIKDAVATAVGTAVKAAVAEIGKGATPPTDTDAQAAVAAGLKAAHAISVGEDPKDSFKSFGHFFKEASPMLRGGGRAVTQAMKLYVSGDGPHIEVFKTVGSDEMNTIVDSEGGFLIPPEYSQTIMKRAYDNPIYDRLNPLPVTGNSLTIPALADDNRADGSRMARGYWMGERSQHTASQMKFRQIRLNVHKLGVFTFVTSEMLDDAPYAVETLVREAAGDEIAFTVADAVINGTGAAQPLGILTSPALVAVAKETDQAADTIVAENVENMYVRMPARGRANGVWLIAEDAETQLMKFNIASGTAGQLLYMPPGGLTAAPYSTLFGKPVIPCPFCPTLGDQGDIMFVDFSQVYSIAKGLQSAASTHLRFDYDETALRFSLRIDAQPAWDTPITPYKATGHTMSPYVTLAERA